jgi:hypothetical protein
MDVVSSNPGKSASLKQSLLYADAHNETLRQRWTLVSDTQCVRQLRLTISINKRKIVDLYFQALRSKLGNSTKLIFLYEDGSFESATRVRRRRANEEYGKNC